MTPPNPLLSGVEPDAGAVPVARPRAASRHDPVTSGLQRMFETIAAEPIPDDFMRLLDSIDASADQLSSAQHATVIAPTPGHPNGARNSNGGAK